MDHKEISKLVDVNVSNQTMTVKFLLNTVNAMSDENEPWQTIEECFAWSKMQQLCLDFSEVRFLSSVTLGKILNLNRKFKDQVELTNVNDRILEVFLVSGLDRVVNIRRNEEPVPVSLNVIG